VEAIKSQFDNLVRDLLNLYSQDFVAAWKRALGKLRIRPLNAGKPKYETLIAAAASTSPIRLLIESIRDESALTRARKDTKASTGDATKEAPTPSLFGAQGGSPGAYIEAQLTPFRQVVEGDGSRRLIDIILSDLTAINNSLQTIALNPAQKQQATSALRVQAAQFRNDALRMPQPFGTMLSQQATSFERPTEE